MKRIFVLLFFGFLALAQGHSQNVKFFPNCLDKPFMEYESGQVLTARPEGVRTGFAWMIYASMDGVNGYRNSSLSGTPTSFRMMDPFIVIEELADVVRAVRPASVSGTSLLAGYEENAFWFRKTDMLLWSGSMVQPNVVVGEHRAEFFRKAMVINRLAMETTVVAETGFFSRPDFSPQFFREEARSFNILFVLKETDDFLLLGRQERWRTAQEGRNVVRGWVSKQYLTPWNHHLALEMNWENSSTRQPTKIFSELANAMVFQSNAGYIPPPAEGNVIFTEDERYSRRGSGMLNRFFVLTEGIDMTDRYPKLGVVGEVHIEGIEGSGCLPENISPEVISRIREQVVEGIGKVQTVNILFAVDGTNSMEPYQASIIAALESTMQSIINEYRERDLRFNLAGVIYRDEDDCYPIDFSNSREWTNEVGVMTAFFRNNLTAYKAQKCVPGICCGLTHPEGLFHGIYEAVRAYPVDPVNTNYLILIGDAGDNPSSYPNIQQSHVVDVLHRNNYNILAYQVDHREHPSMAYDNFRTEVREIIAGVSARKNQGLSSSMQGFLASCPTAQPFFNPIISGLPTSFDQNAHFASEIGSGMVTTLTVRSDRFPVIARAMFPADEETLSVNMVGQFLSRDLSNLAVDTDNFIRSIGSALDGVEAGHTARILLFALTIGLDVENTVVLLSEFNEIYQEGFSAYHPDHAGPDPQFHYVAWISHPKTMETMQHFQHLIPAATSLAPALLRDALYNVWRQMLVEELKLVTPSEFPQLTIAQNITFLTGLPAPEVFNNYRNQDIHFESEFPSNLLYGLCLDLIIANGYMRSVLEQSNMLNFNFLWQYRPYFQHFLQSHDFTIPSMEVFESFVRSIADRYSTLNFDNYPRMTVDHLRPNQPLFWHYWVDTRGFPSLISNPSAIVLELAGNQFE